MSQPTSPVPSPPTQLSPEPPAWLADLGLAARPRLAPLTRTTPLLVWHVEVRLEAWPVARDAELTQEETWNGKALVCSSANVPGPGFAEEELVTRLQRAAPETTVTWTEGRVPNVVWFRAMDAAVRQHVPLLEGRRRGLPDIIQWRAGAPDLRCVEYKGPTPARPTCLDSMSSTQALWIQRAFDLGYLDLARFAVASWRPSPEDSIRLLAEAAASRR